MVGVRQISHILRSAYGGYAVCIDALRGDDSPDAQQFLAKWDSISDSDKRLTSIEEQCVASGLSTRRLVEVITGAMLSQSGDITKLLVASAQPRIIKKTIDRAMDDDGEKDREQFHKATGFLPTPKGATINLNQINAQPKITADDIPDDRLPSADEFYLDLQSVTKGQKQLPPASEAPVNAPEIEDDFLDGDI